MGCLILPLKPEFKKYCIVKNNIMHENEVLNSLYGRLNLDSNFKLMRGVNNNTIKCYIGNSHSGNIKKSRLPVPEPTESNKYLDRIDITKPIIFKCDSSHDSFQYLDRKYKVAYNTLKEIIHDKNLKTCKIVINTQSDLVGHDVYIELFKSLPNLEIIFKSTGVGTKSRAGAPSILRINKCMAKLRENNIKVSFK